MSPVGTSAAARTLKGRRGPTYTMRIAFYAPLKPPDHPVASGDRAMARALIAALTIGGHDVGAVSAFRSYDSGCAHRQERLRTVGLRLADRIARRISAGRKP